MVDVVGKSGKNGKWVDEIWCKSMMCWVPALVSLGSQSAMAFAMSLPSWESSRNIRDPMTSSGKYLSQTGVTSASNKKWWLIGRDFCNGLLFSACTYSIYLFSYTAYVCQKWQNRQAVWRDQMVQFTKWVPNFCQCPRNPSQKPVKHRGKFETMGTGRNPGTQCDRNAWFI